MLRRIDKPSPTQYARRLVPALKRENIMARKPASKIDEKLLTKGEIRKLNALRKSVGEDIGEKTFVEWLRKKPVAMTETEDKNAALIADTLIPLIQKNKLQIPRGGYLVRRGRGRIIVERPASD
jgi:phage antirepressor YoqD-like protein